MKYFSEGISVAPVQKNNNALEKQSLCSLRFTSIYRNVIKAVTSPSCEM